MAPSSSSHSSSPLVFILLFIFTLAVRTTPVASQISAPTEPLCDDWGESREGAVSVLEGEAGWLSCPLFSHPTVYNFTSAKSTGHNLSWYRFPEGQDLEEAIKYSTRLSKDQERLWLQPAIAQDSGLYICLLQNKSSCSKIGMRLKVLPREDVDAVCHLPVAAPIPQTDIPLQGSQRIDCPGLQDVAKIADTKPTIDWYHLTVHGKCDKYPFWNTERQLEGSSLNFLIMNDNFRGLYFCTVTYVRKRQTLNFTRIINVTAVCETIAPQLTPR